MSEAWRTGKLEALIQRSLRGVDKCDRDLRFLCSDESNSQTLTLLDLQ
jgi:hypothetical protein